VAEIWRNSIFGRKKTGNMNDLDEQAFKQLFRESYEKCFGHALLQPMNETECKLFYTQIFDATGLVIGWKSLKNYSSFILEGTSAKPENPSVASLDSLARYLANAPYSSEPERKDNESHYPYWFSFKEKFHRAKQKQTITHPKKYVHNVLLASGFFIIVVSLILFKSKNRPNSGPFQDNFQDLSMTALKQKGWFLLSPDTFFWNRRSETPGQLTLFTLRGDNWPALKETTGIRNLLLRKIDDDCFETEIHFMGFLPDQEWQQAGLLLLEDSSFNGKAIRVSLTYNDNFGGYHRPAEIIVQAITSLGKDDKEPEEIAHQPVANIDSVHANPAMQRNLKNGSLRIIREGRRFRFLFAGGSVSNPAFKEIVTHEFDIRPRYIGIFAMKGFVDGSMNQPVHITGFRYRGIKCVQ
jgi:hypothetical protein